MRKLVSTRSASPDLTDGILSIDIDAEETRGSAVLTVNTDEQYSDDNHNPGAEIVLSIDPLSPVTGIGTKIAINDTKALPGLKIEVADSDKVILESDTALKTLMSM